MLPESYAKSHRIIIFDFDKEKNVLKVAMIDPLDLEVLEFQRAKFRDMQVIPHLMTPSSLKHALKQYKKKIGEEFNKIIEENLKQSIVSGVSTTTDLSRMAEAIPIITILDSILEHASSLGSSDIHFEPFEDKFLIRFRIDGIMHEILSLPKQIAPILVARVKVLANLQIDIHTSPQDGRFRFEMEDQKIDVRVNIMPTFHGEKTEMRLLRGSARPLSLNELGISEEHIKTIEENLAIFLHLL